MRNRTTLKQKTCDEIKQIIYDRRLVDSTITSIKSTSTGGLFKNGLLGKLAKNQ